MTAPLNARERAAELANAERVKRGGGYGWSANDFIDGDVYAALAAFVHEVSQELKACGIGVCHPLYKFILPDPPADNRAKHIAGAVDYATSEWTLVTEELKAKRLEEILARYGLQIVPAQP